MKNTRLLSFKINGDDRGSLVALEQEQDIPFNVKRIYYIFDTKKGVVRGKHAHKKLEQILICVNGSCKIELDNGHEKKTVTLDHPGEGLWFFVVSCGFNHFANR